MSNITISMCLSDADTAQKRISIWERNKKKEKNKRKKRNLDQMGCLRHEHNRHMGQARRDRTPRHNGARSRRPSPPSSTQSRRLPRPGSAFQSSSTPSASAHSRPSFTVDSKGSHEKPKEPVNTNSAAATPGPSGSSSRRPTATPAAMPSKYLAIDCEMVGAGPKGCINQLARCSIVSYDGDVVYDKFINPSMPVTDYRTRWSGIRYRDLVRATPFSVAQKEILKLLMGKVVIGHAIHNDFKALGYAHPAALTRDTSRIPLLNQKAGFADNECASLKRLTKAIFNRDIQAGRKGHSSVEDARATMELYKVVEQEWERRLAS